MISRKDVLPSYDNQGKTSYQDLISQKDCLPRHDIMTRRLAKIMISRKDIFPWYILARRLSEISYLGKTSFRDIYLDKTSFRDIISWQEVLLQYYVLVRCLSLIIISRKDDFPWYHISVKRHSVIFYLGKTSFHVCVIAERRRFISVFRLSEIKYLGNTKTRMVTLSFRT